MLPLPFFSNVDLQRVESSQGGLLREKKHAYKYEDWSEEIHDILQEKQFLYLRKTVSALWTDEEGFPPVPGGK